MSISFGAGGYGVLAVNTTKVSLSATGDLQTYSLPAGQLAKTGDFLEMEATITPTTTYTGTVGLSFGGTSVAAYGGTGTNQPLRLWGRVIRTGAATQKYTGNLIIQDSGTNIVFTYYGTIAETLSAAITVKTSISAHTSGEINSELLVVKFGSL